jgi:folate-binding protein YgfZ
MNESTSQHITMIPAVSLDGYAAARHGAAVIDRSQRGRLIVTGVDRRAYLQGLLTNDIAALEPGRGCYAAYLTPQGRMIADLHVYELGDEMLLALERGTRDTVLRNLDQFVFTEDVQLRDATDSLAQMAVVGPGAAATVSNLLAAPADVASLSEHGVVRAQWERHPVTVARIDDAGERGFDLFVDAAESARLVAALGRAGVPLLDDATAEAIRIEAGVPRFHRDMNEETIPLEAGIESRAISFTKGCYVGQEVVIRVLHRGHGRVARKLVGLVLDGSQPAAAGSIVRSDDREIGRVTSSAFSPALQKPIALAYVHRDFVAPGTAVSVDGERGEVAALPFIAPKITDRRGAGPPGTV